MPIERGQDANPGPLALNARGVGLPDRAPAARQGPAGDGPQARGVKDKRGRARKKQGLPWLGQPQQRWRRGWDSNPRWPKGPQRFSRPPRSTTPAPLRVAPPLYKACPKFPGLRGPAIAWRAGVHGMGCWVGGWRGAPQPSGNALWRWVCTLRVRAPGWGAQSSTCCPNCGKLTGPMPAAAIFSISAVAGPSSPCTRKMPFTRSLTAAAYCSRKV